MNGLENTGVMALAKPQPAEPRRRVFRTEDCVVSR